MTPPSRAIPPADRPAARSCRSEDGRIRTAFYLGMSTFGRHRPDLAQELMGGELPIRWQNKLARTNEGNEAVQDLLDELAPDDGDETLFCHFLLASRMAPEEPRSRRLWDQLARRAYEQANDRGEDWNPVLDALADHPHVSGPPLYSLEPAREETVAVAELHVPRWVLGPGGETEVRDVMEGPEIQWLRRLLLDIRLDRGPLAGSLLKGSLSSNPQSSGRLLARGRARALVAARSIREVREPETLERFLSAFRSEAFRMAVALRANAWSPAVLEALLPCPDAVMALTANPSGRAYMRSDEGIRTMSAWLRAHLDEEPKGRSHAGTHLATLMGIVGLGGPPFPEDVRARLLDALAVDPAVVGGFALGDPGLGDRELSRLADAGAYFTPLQVLRHPGVTEAIACQVLREGAERPGGGPEVRSALQNSDVWCLRRDGKKPAGDEALQARVLRRAARELPLDGAQAIPRAPHADEETLDLLLDRIEERRGTEEASDDLIVSPSRYAVAKRIAQTRRAQEAPRLARRLLKLGAPRVTENLLDSQNRTIWQAVVERLRRDGEEETILEWLSFHDPPEGATLPHALLLMMLASPQPEVRTRGVSLCGGIIQGDPGDKLRA